MPHDEEGKEHDAEEDMDEEDEKEVPPEHSGKGALAGGMVAPAVLCGIGAVGYQVFFNQKPQTDLGG